MEVQMLYFYPKLPAVLSLLTRLDRTQKYILWLLAEHAHRSFPPAATAAWHWDEMSLHWPGLRQQEQAGTSSSNSSVILHHVKQFSSHQTSLQQDAAEGFTENTCSPKTRFVVSGENTEADYNILIQPVTADLTESSAAVKGCAGRFT